jgi:diaminohydroxyphosphoribosylaminopyrimidine deaminase/5-amino-6-(5-phosphoribosylamino)uracil reductase
MSDFDFMKLALAQGRLGLGFTAPNPSVGAIIVRNGEILGKGYHVRAGAPHAEIEAIADAHRNGHDLIGSEIFITLEPCSTEGRTPPCTSALLKEGFQRVVWAADDPDVRHCGAARKLLEQRGVEVKTGVLAEEADYLHRAFFKVQRTGLPWVIVKTALSLDGRITRPPGEGQWLTGDKARAEVQEIRGEADAIVTSGATARADNPRLSYRGKRVGKNQPARVVISRQEQGGLPLTAHLLNDGELTRFEKGDLASMLRRLAAEGLHTVLVEAGGGLVGDLLDARLVDEWVSYFAPLICGGPSPAVGGKGIGELFKRPRLHRIESARLGDDVRVRGLVSYLES